MTTHKLSFPHDLLVMYWENSDYDLTAVKGKCINCPNDLKESVAVITQVGLERIPSFIDPESVKFGFCAPCVSTKISNEPQFNGAVGFDDGMGLTHLICVDVIKLESCFNKPQVTSTFSEEQINHMKAAIIRNHDNPKFEKQREYSQHKFQCVKENCRGYKDISDTNKRMLMNMRQHGFVVCIDCSTIGAGQGLKGGCSSLTCSECAAKICAFCLNGATGLKHDLAQCTSRYARRIFPPARFCACPAD